MLTSAVLLLLYVTSMPTAPILVDRISVPAGQDIRAMGKLAKVGLISIFCDNNEDGRFPGTCDDQVLLLFLSLAPRGFSPGTPVFPSPQKPTLPNSNSIWNAPARLNEFIWTLKCFVGKKAIYNFFWRGQLDGEEEVNSKTFWFPVEEIQTVFNGDRTRLKIFIYLLLLSSILLARCLR